MTRSEALRVALAYGMHWQNRSPNDPIFIALAERLIDFEDCELAMMVATYCGYYAEPEDADDFLKSLKEMEEWAKPPPTQSPS